MRRFSVLLVDDEARILNFLKAKLNVVGYDVLTANNGADALQQVRRQEPYVMVLDLIMPGMNGLDVLKELRTFSTIPVIVLSAKGTDSDKIEGLRRGADDYLAKPFNPDELIARIEAVRRRVEPEAKLQAPEKLKLGDVVIDFNSRIVMVNGVSKTLTRIEWLLLNEMVRNIGHLLLYEDLLTRVWGPEYRGDVQLLRTWMSRLRYKLEDDPTNPKLIHTITKTGYLINEPSAE